MRRAYNSICYSTNLTHVFAKTTEGREKLKDRVTICACANVIGTIKAATVADWKSSSTTLLYTNGVYEAQKVHESARLCFGSHFMTILCHMPKRK